MSIHLLRRLRFITPQMREALNVGFIILVFVLMVGYLALSGKLVKILPFVFAANPWWLACAFLCELGYLACEVLSLMVAAKMMQVRLKLPELVSVSLLGQLFGNLTPMASGSQPAQGWVLVKKGVPLGSTTSTLLSKFIIFQGVLTVLAAAMLAVRFDFFRESYSGFIYVTLVGFAVHVGVFIVLLALGLFPGGMQRAAKKTVRMLRKRGIGSPDRLENWQHKIDHEAAQFKSSFRGLKKRPHLLWLQSAVTALQFTLFCMVPYFVLRALGIEGIDFLTVLAAAGFVLVIQSAVPVPGGAGGAEGSFALFFGLFIGSSELTWAALLLWRMITYYIPILIELPSMLAAGRPPRSARIP